MKRLVSAAMLSALVALVVGVSSPSADAVRYQRCDAVYHAVLVSGPTFNWTLNVHFVHPGSTFSGTASLATPSPATGTVEGTFTTAGVMDTHLVYIIDEVTYTYHLTAASANHFATFTTTASYLTYTDDHGVFHSDNFGAASTTLTRTSITCTNYKNHGEYVSSQTEVPRDDAAQSLIGKPVH